MHFFTKFWKFKKNAFFRYVKRLGMTTVGMPGHGFTFPVEGIVPVIFSSMSELYTCYIVQWEALEVVLPLCKSKFSITEVWDNHNLRTGML